MKKQTIVMIIKGQEVEFNVDIIKYNNFLNSGAGKNKPQAINNFLVGCCSEKNKETLSKIMADEPGAAMELLEAIITEFAPDVGVVVKKSKTEPSNSGETA